MKKYIMLLTIVSIFIISFTGCKKAATTNAEKISNTATTIKATIKESSTSSTKAEVQADTDTVPSTREEEKSTASNEIESIKNTENPTIAAGDGDSTEIEKASDPVPTTPESKHQEPVTQAPEQTQPSDSSNNSNNSSGRYETLLDGYTYETFWDGFYIGSWDGTLSTDGFKLLWRRTGDDGTLYEWIWFGYCGYESLIITLPNGDKYVDYIDDDCRLLTTREEVIGAFMDGFNDTRAKYGLSRVQVNWDVCDAAQVWSDHMASKCALEHGLEEDILLKPFGTEYYNGGSYGCEIGEILTYGVVYSTGISQCGHVGANTEPELGVVGVGYSFGYHYSDIRSEEAAKWEECYYWEVMITYHNQGN